MSFLGSEKSLDNELVFDTHMLHGLKVIFVFGNLELGGAERQGLILARFLKEEHKASVEIWGLSSEAGRLSRLCDEYGIPWRGVPFAWPCQWFMFHRQLRELVRFARYLRQAKPDIVLPYIYLPNIVCGLTWKFSGAKLCVWNQRDEGLLSTGNIWERIAVYLTPCFISNSITGKNFLVRRYQIDPEKILVIFNGIELTEAVSDRKTWRGVLGVNEDHFLACMVGNIHRYKDHSTLLHAWKKVLEGTRNLSPAPVLLLAGRFDDGEQELMDLASMLDLGSDIRFLGRVDDITGLLGAVDLYVHSSKSEGCPNAVIEAMGSALPVVATDIPGIREVIGRDKFRFLVPVGNSEAMADRMLEFYNDKAMQRAVGSDLKKRAEKKYNSKVMCQITVSVIQNHLDTE